VYPYDYKVSELPIYRYNFTIPFIDFFAWLGWAYDLKTVSDATIRKRVERTGDGTHRYSEKLDMNSNLSTPRDVDHFWGYGELRRLKVLHFINSLSEQMIRIC
jgi:stearoyl-CoA desaturase (Delta-9 desaturase)